jgi:biotin operon repressor
MINQFLNVLWSPAASSRTPMKQQKEGVVMSKYDIILNALRTNDNGISSVKLAKIAKTTRGTVSARIAEMRDEGYAILARRGSDNKNIYMLESGSRSKRVMSMYRQKGASAFFAS